jgi:hypothetical protein
MPYITTEVEVDIELDCFDDEDLIEECRNRNLDVYSSESEIRNNLIEIYQLRRQGKSFENELNRLICDALGVVI